MQWLAQLDVSVFRCINGLASRNSFLDDTMQFCAGNVFFAPVLIALGMLVIWKGSTRQRVCVFAMLVLLAVGDPFIWNTIKHGIDRARPFEQLDNVQVILGRGNSGSMPSSHTANWFAASAIMFFFYRRTIWFMLPISLIIGFSRIYCGVHFPSDVLAGAVLGAGYGFAGMVALNWLWRVAGAKWFPLWHQQLRSRINSTPVLPSSLPAEALDGHWLRLGYVVIAVLLVSRLFYIGSGIVELSEDEAYYWLWSKHPDLSYFSKPPLVAYTHLLGTALLGDNALGVRFFSSLIAATISFLVLRFLARLGRAREGFWLIAIVTATPMMAAGSVLMTIDPLSVLFWTATTIAGWRAVQHNGTNRQWLWTGLWMGLGFLSKYTALFQLLCFAVLFVVWPPARRHLKKPGPYLALSVLLICSTPVLIWNAQHDWITVSHVADNAKVGSGWHPAVVRFLTEESVLLHPIFLIATLWSGFALWRNKPVEPLKIYLFSMGAPLFLSYLLYSFHSRVQPNWIAPSVVPLFCLMTLFWSDKLRAGVAWIRDAFAGALIVGLIAVVVLHDTDLTQKLFGFTLPARMDPLRRARGWREAAQFIGKKRQELALQEKRPVFLIGHHYGTASELTFYLPEAKENVPSKPLVYCLGEKAPSNQFFFWPGYENRKGDNAIFVRDVGLRTDRPRPAPKQLSAQFQSVTELGTFDVARGHRVMRRVQLFVCRELR